MLAQSNPQVFGQLSGGLAYPQPLAQVWILTHRCDHESPTTILRAYESEDRANADLALLRQDASMGTSGTFEVQAVLITR